MLPQEAGNLSFAQDKHPAPVPSGVTPMATGLGWPGLAGTFTLFPWRQIIPQHYAGLAPCKVTNTSLISPVGISGEPALKWGPCSAKPAWGAQPQRGLELQSGAASGEAAAPAYRLVLQALQVDDERLVDFLASGDFRERHGSLAQQLLLQQLVNTGGKKHY